MGKCACCWLTGVNSLDACSGGRGQANVAHRQSACRGDECLAKVLMGCWSRSMRLCHEPWLVAHWFFPVKRWRKKNSVFFFFFFFFALGFFLFLFCFFNTVVYPVVQGVVFWEESEKNGLGVAPRSCFGVQGGCFLSSLSEGSAPRPLPSPVLLPPLSPVIGSNEGR